jgi:16S rRNA G1207 methylase RsmC
MHDNTIPAAPEDDPYFKARLSLAFGGATLEFCTAALLASAHRIDEGALLLLRALHEQAAPPAALLELGCGYGVIGLTLARLHPQARVLMTDKDLLALRYTDFNRRLNGLENVTLLAGVGLEAAPDLPLDLLVCDMPAKIGDRAIEHDFLLAPLERLGPGGSYWILADSQLNRLLPNLARRHKLALSEVIRRSGRIVYQVRSKK